MGASKKKTTKKIEEIQTTQSLAPVKKSKHNYKLSEEDRKTIILEYYLNKNKHNVDVLLDRYNISRRTLYNILKNKKYEEEVNRYITESKQNFAKKTTLIIDKAINKINEKIDNEEVNAKDLITITGILYDKNRLENNLSTSNNSININIKVEK